MNLKKMPIAGVYIDPTKVVAISGIYLAGIPCIRIWHVSGSHQEIELQGTSVEDWFEALSQPNPNGRL